MRLPRLLLFGALALLSPMSSFVPATALLAKQTRSCGSEFYVNVDGKCVHRLELADRPPAGATAKCNDST